MEPLAAVTIEIHYRYLVDVAHLSQVDIEAMKEEAFILACEEHDVATRYESPDNNQCDGWMIYDEDGEAI